MTKEEIKKEIENIKNDCLDKKESIESQAMKIIKGRDKLYIWEYADLSKYYDELEILTQKITLIEKILRLF